MLLDFVRYFKRNATGDLNIQEDSDQKYAAGQIPLASLSDNSFPLPWWEGIKGRGKQVCPCHPNIRIGLRGCAFAKILLTRYHLLVYSISF